MSASTWTSSTHQRHKFRLFFSSSPRVSRDPNEQDHVLSWIGVSEHERLGTLNPESRQLAGRYRQVLESWNDRPPLDALAQLTTPRSFALEDIECVLEDARNLSRRRGRPALTAGLHSSPAPAQPVMPGQMPIVTPADSAEVTRVPPPLERQEGGTEEPAPPDIKEVIGNSRRDPVEVLLDRCAHQLRSPDYIGLPESVKALSRELDNPDAQRPERRKQYWNIVADRGLLGLALPGWQLHEMYPTFLRAAFGRRSISYEDYCTIEEALGSTPHSTLVEALDRIGVTGIHTRVILHQAVGADALMEEFRTGKLDLGNLIYAAATEELTSPHLRIISAVIVRLLNDPAMMRKKAGIVIVLRNHGYLAQVLQRHEPDDHEYQVSTLSKLLLAAYARKLDRATAGQIFWDGDENAPTLDLLGAVVLQLHDPADTWFAVHEWAIAYATRAGYDANTRDNLMHRFSFERPLTVTQVITTPADTGVSPPEDQHPFGSHIEEAKSANRGISRFFRGQVKISETKPTDSPKPSQQEDEP